MSQTCCFLCKTVFDEKARYDIRTTFTASSEILLLNLIEIVVKEKVSIYNQPDICFECCELLHELDELNQRTKQISDKLLSYFNQNNATIAANAFNETDVPLGNIVNTDVLNKNLLNPTGNGCNKCTMTFNTSEELQEHSKTHVVKTYMCRICNKMFVSKNGAASHLRQVHPEEVAAAIRDSAEENKETPQKLEESEDVGADIEFGTISEESVAEIKEEAPKNVHECPVCQKEFKFRSEMKNHLKIHDNFKPYICEICGKDFRLRSNLNVHLDMHNGINPFTCMYCRKSFMQRGSLQRHVRIHTGEKPYQCDLCGQTFIHYSSFKVHSQQHSGEKKIECPMCDLRFYDNSHLKRHMRLHTGEKNYICSECGKRFAEKYNMLSHQKVHGMPGPKTKKKKAE